jgi:hypothetical protein
MTVPVTRTPTAHKTTTTMSKIGARGTPGTPTSSNAAPRIQPAAPSMPPSRENLTPLSEFEQGRSMVDQGSTSRPLSFKEL